MQKDIILITTKNVKTGVKRVENELVEEWERMGCTVSKVTQRGEILYDSFAENNVNNLQKGSKKSITKYYYRFFALRRMFKAHNGASVVALALPADCFAGLLSIFTRKRVIVSERNDPRQYPNSKMYRILRDFCFCLADTCIFQTNDAMRCFNKRVQKKGVVIPNPINQELEKFEWKRNNNNVIAVGRLNTQKNYPMLLRAFSIFSSCHPEYKLEIYGDGALEEELKKQCADLKIESKVYFKGFVSNIFPIMAESAMYVSSSNYEGISNAMLEALAIGIPTICTDCPVGGSREMIENGENGFLIPAGNAEKLANAMCTIAKDDKLAKSLSVNSQKIKQKYPLNTIAMKWLECM